ncbi:DUF2867 domain-containing protein [Pararhodonellum marinum]|uniref:DUF2867 domain-containing protein n=1 Tax=Pararhodonellum marinum TaxID=2755358 RepID=UPI00188EE5A2|nr:DUF2867 domain-containing protein [Pararhodonellum marinum]
MHKFPPENCLIEIYERPIETGKEEVLENIWTIGGENGWYFGTSLWKIRGFLDRCLGGIGYRKGRNHPTELRENDPLDFWKVIRADRDEKTLLLKGEMKIPGEVWLEWKIHSTLGGSQLTQSVYFAPKGLWGRLYWHLVKPVHRVVFGQLAKKLTQQP